MQPAGGRTRKEGMTGRCVSGREVCEWQGGV